MNPQTMQSNIENNNYHSNFIETSYFNQVISSRTILSNIVGILHEQEENMRSVILSNSIQNSRLNNNSVIPNRNRGNLPNDHNIFRPTSIFPNNPAQRERHRNRYMRPPTRRRGDGSMPTSNFFSELLNGNNRHTTTNDAFQFDFFSPVPVRPTPREIQQATRRVVFRTIEEPVNVVCPISQENFNPDDEVIQIRHCRHNFTPEHFNTWFSRNVRCPCCRYDIRNDSSNIEPNAANTRDAQPSTRPIPPTETVSADTPATEPLPNTLEINIDTPETLNSMITLISNSLAQQFENSGLDASSNISIQYSIVTPNDSEHTDNTDNVDNTNNVDNTDNTDNNDNVDNTDNTDNNDNVDNTDNTDNNDNN